jgi:hypothetical protein
MSVTKKFPPIKYTSRDFRTIKSDLVEHAKRYYSSTFKDFNEAGFGSLMLDTVAYVGDILSFYLDYSVNESFLETAVEYENVLKLGKQLGYKFQGSPAASGLVTLYIIAPANESGMGVNTRFLPILRRGSSFASINGAGFVLNEDVNFADPNNEMVVARVNETSGAPTFYAIRATGRVISGEFGEEIVEVGDLEKFRRIKLSSSDITEVLSVVDTDGHSYYEVDYLSQDVVYKIMPQRNSGIENPQSILKPIVVPRRFIVERDKSDTFLQFGAGSEGSTIADPLVDPSKVIASYHAKDYVLDSNFDPSNLLGSDKMGISPSNTTLRIIYRKNTSADVNAATDSITEVVGASMIFENESGLDAGTKESVIDSLEVTNNQPILGDVSFPSIEELKIRIKDSFATQNRAVTSEDYKSLIYSMPGELGSIKRVRVIPDPCSFRRNLNVYVISENTDGSLIPANAIIKRNLKTWLNRSKMINDTIDIYDAKIVNLAIEFVAVSDVGVNKFEVLQSAIDSLKIFYSKTYDIGEHFSITDVYNVLNSVPGIADTTKVRITKKTGGLYSTTVFDLDSAISADGRFIDIPKNVIVEIKLPDDDIIGSIK